MINITCNNKEVRSGTCADIGDSNVVAYISFFDTINNTERKLYQPVYGDFKTSTAYLFDLSGNSITLTYADSNKTRTELEDLLVDCCGCAATGTVTSVAAGDGMDFPTITTSGSVVLGTPSSITLTSSNSVTTNSHTHAFAPAGTAGQYIRGDGTLATMPSISVDANKIAFGNSSGTGLTSHYQISVSSNSIILGSGTVGANMNSLYIGHGSAVNAPYSLIISDANLAVLSGAGNKAATLVAGSSNLITGGQDAYRNAIIGGSNTITASSASSVNNRIIGMSSNISNAQNNTVIGSYFSSTHDRVTFIGDGYPSTITSSSQYMLYMRGYNGFVIYKDSSNQIMSANSSTQITINNLAGSGTRMVVANSSGQLSTQTIPSGASAVWKVQGGSTDATTNTQNIYHNANVWLGDGSGSSSSYRLHVSGISYFTGSMTLNNITSIQAWNNAASQQLKIAQLDSSNIFNYAENYLKIVGQGEQAGGITISAYPHTRKDYISAYPRNVLVTNSTGNLLSLPGECYKNDNVNTALSSDESHSADSTWRTVTWDTVNTPSWSQYGVDTTSGNMKMKLPTSTYEYGTHLIFVTINYTGGTSSEVNAEIRINGSTVIGSATTNATASKNTLTFFTVIDNNATYQGSVVSLHIRVATGTGSITVKSGSKMVMIAAGAPLPA